MVDKSTMYNSVRTELLAYLKGGSVALDITEWVWDDLAKNVPDFDAAIPEQNEEATELYDACFAEILEKIADAIK